MTVHARAATTGLAAAAVAAAMLSAAPRADPVDPHLFAAWQWRSIGPFDGGPVTSVAGVVSEPDTFYFSSESGGVWKTTDAGLVWRPVFDAQATPAVNALAVAESDARVVYAGTGGSPASASDGLYRSSDEGQTWSLTTAMRGRTISALVVDPRQADRLLVAVDDAAGNDSGIFQSTDGGRTATRVLPSTPGAAVVIAGAPDDANVIVAATASRRALDGGARDPTAGSGVFKSEDGGTTWRPIGRGLVDAGGNAATGLSIAASSAGHLVAFVCSQAQGTLYVSSDAGESWTKAAPERAPDTTAACPARVAIDRRDPAIVYVASASGAWKSADGGRTLHRWPQDPVWPSGSLWVNGGHPGIAILGGPAGAAVTTNGGATWSPRTNQPTGVFLNVATDAAFPYRVCGAPHAGMPVCNVSRGEAGTIDDRDWIAVGSRPAGSVAPDPADADVIFTGALERFDRRSGQSQVVSLSPAERLASGTVTFSPMDPRTLFYGVVTLSKTVNGGLAWTTVSPDLTAGTQGARTATPRAPSAISAISPSPVDGRTIWVGATNGVVHVTRDGGATWADVTPADFTASATVARIESSHFDPNVSYLASAGAGLWRTRDGGATWTRLSSGLPQEASISGVREDSLRRGLLFAATSRSVFLSLDDGDTWQPFALNLPPAPVTDVAISDRDVVVSTAGRGFWVLDDISPLRQMTPDVARTDVFLVRPATAWRVRRALPLADDGRHAPLAMRPPTPAAIWYVVGPGGGAPITIEIIDGTSGDLLRRFSTDDASSPLDATPGLHRIDWDATYTPVAGHTMFAMPGVYQVRLTSRARLLRQAIILRMDPRVHVSTAELDAQHALSRTLYRKLGDLMKAAARPDVDHTAAADVTTTIGALLDAVQQSDTRPTPAMMTAATAALDRAASVVGTAP